MAGGICRLRSGVLEQSDEFLLFSPLCAGRATLLRSGGTGGHTRYLPANRRVFANPVHLDGKRATRSLDSRMGARWRHRVPSATLRPSGPPEHAKEWFGLEPRSESQFA